MEGLGLEAWEIVLLLAFYFGLYILAKKFVLAMQKRKNNGIGGK